jgi:cytochrome c556
MSLGARLGYGAVAATLSASLYFASAWAAAPINASDENTIEYRKNIMKTQDSQAAAIGQILALMVPDKNLTLHFEALLIATRQAKEAFKPNVPGGGARPEVWENWEDFSARLDKAEENLVKAVATAKAQGGSGSIGEDAIEAMNSCKDCHDTYRNKE